MIQLEEFQLCMSDLAEVFSPISERQLEIYYSSLKGESLIELRRAVTYLLETFTYKRFPLLAEIREAITEVQNRSAAYEKMLNDQEERDVSHDFPPPVCNLCSNDPPGFLLVQREGYPVASYCACEKGQKLKATHKAYFERKKRPVTFRKEDES